MLSTRNLYAWTLELLPWPSWISHTLIVRVLNRSRLERSNLHRRLREIRRISHHDIVRSSGHFMSSNVGLSPLREWHCIWHSVSRKHIGDIGEMANFHVSGESVTIQVIVGCDGLGIVWFWIGLLNNVGIRSVSIRMAYLRVIWTRCLE